MSNDVIKHYGTKRHSGRYPWGSGGDPYQSSDFLNKYEALKGRGLSGTEIAKEMGITTTELRTNITWARNEQKRYFMEKVKKDHETGMTKTAIGEKYGLSEGTVRNYLKDENVHKSKQLDTINSTLTKSVSEKEYLDVGPGLEITLGIPSTRLKAVIRKMVEEEGYYLHEVYVRRQSNPDKPTTVKVLTKDPDIKNVVKNSDKISLIESYSNDRGETIADLDPPASFNPKRLKIRYGDEGGSDKDGVIELRPGVEELDMGASHYAQVRIKVGEDRYLKGMAVYGNPKDFPEGTDIIFNTNKPLGMDPRDVLKKTNLEAKSNSEVFGSTIVRQNNSKVLNIVNEEGEWDTWSTSMSSQFLSKQPVKLIKERLDETHDSLLKDLSEIQSLTNPIVKQYLLEKYSDSLNAKAKKLDAKGMSRTKSHVILPFPEMNPDEIYAPNYNDGEKVVLLRYPHGGIFELPEVTVNNKNPKAKQTLGVAPDAIGIHPSVAKKLSGADFDGDTVYVIPNNDNKIKTSRPLKELKDFDPHDYKVSKDSPKNTFRKDPETGKMINTGHTIVDQTKQIEMGKVSNLITDMTIKNATPSEIARAVKHSMVVIDSEKHNLDYKQSAIDNGISALKRKYQTHINPDTGKKSVGASTLISRSKRKINILEPDEVRQLAKDKVDKEGSILRKGLTPSEISKKIGIPEAEVKGYLSGNSFNPYRYSSGSETENLYARHITNLQKLKLEADSSARSIVPPKYSKEAAIKYKDEVKSLNDKLMAAKLNAPRERQAQILTNKLYYSNLTPDMTPEQKKKLKSRSLARARETTGAKKGTIEITDREWEAVQSRAVSNTRLKEILLNADTTQIRRLATPKSSELTPEKEARARQLIKKGYTYEEVGQSLGVSPSAVRRTKLSTAKAQRAKALVAKGMTYEETARMLGVSTSAVQNLLNDE